MSEQYIGLISGTSMDAIDAVLVEIGHGTCQIKATHSQPISAEALKTLRAVVGHPENVPVEKLGELDALLGRDFAEAANKLIRVSGEARQAIRAIGSHGQTVFHSPRGPVPFTMQLGDPNLIAEHTGITTIADFRRRDLAVGGEGAPLVPAFHQAIFGDPAGPRAVCNIGGIANLSLIVPGKPVTGFDTGPGNALMDAWIRLQLGCQFDKNGDWAATAEPDENLLASLLEYGYFHRSPPKSTGVEEFNLAWLQRHLEPIPDALAPAAVQSTLCQLTAETIAESLTRACPEAGSIYLCGGGAHNETLVRRLRDRLGGWHLGTTDDLGIGVDWVEAAAFAWLARRTLAGLPGNVPEVTGADREVVLGAIYQG